MRHALKKPKENCGFTLIELSIVMVIIALVVAGIVVGKDMVQTARNRATVSQIESFDSAASAFRMKYGGLPGDIVNPASKGLSKPTGYLASGTDNGAGNGVIDTYAGTGYQVGEVLSFWRHLQETGLINSTVDPNITSCGAAGVSIAETEWKKYWPLAALNDGSYFMMIPGYTIVGNFAPSPLPPWTGTQDGKSYYVLGKSYQWYQCTIAFGGAQASSLQPSSAYYIDNKMDDGLPGSGKVQARKNYQAMIDAPTYASTDCASNATTYNLKNYNPSANWGFGACLLRIDAKF